MNGSKAKQADAISSIRLSRVFKPIPPISDAKVLTGRQKPLAGLALLFAEIRTESGLAGLGFSFCLRAGSLAQYAHACELAPELLGEDPNDIGRLWDKLMWIGASIGRSGLAPQAVAAFDIALWDLKAKRVGLPLAKLLGAYRESVPCYNTSGSYLSASTGEMLDNIDGALAKGDRRHQDEGRPARLAAGPGAGGGGACAPGRRLPP